MLTNILRRGGAWRFAALGLLTASILSFGLNGQGGPPSASAHQGVPEPVCGTMNIPPILQYFGQEGGPTGWHLHLWVVPYSPDLYAAWCDGGSGGV